jgi:hypothetical protein
MWLDFTGRSRSISGQILQYLYVRAFDFNPIESSLDRCLEILWTRHLLHPTTTAMTSRDKILGRIPVAVVWVVLKSLHQKVGSPVMTRSLTSIQLTPAVPLANILPNTSRNGIVFA